MISIGHNIRMDRTDVEQAIRARALAIASARGAIPAGIDVQDFQNRAVVHYNITQVVGPVSPDGSAITQLVVLDVTITWEG